MLLQELKQPFKYAREERVGLESREEGEGRKGAPVRGWERVWQQREPASRLPASLAAFSCLFFFLPFFFSSPFFYLLSRAFFEGCIWLGSGFYCPPHGRPPALPRQPSPGPCSPRGPRPVVRKKEKVEIAIFPAAAPGVCMKRLFEQFLFDPLA